jgi:transposase
VLQKAPETVLLSEDEAWMDLQATTMKAWSPRGQTPVVRVDPGRRKAGFYGTLDLQTGQEWVLRSEHFQAETTVHHLQQLLDAYPDRPILLLWDRATWHQGEPIRQVLATNPRLEIMCFPVATPDLNPQEQVWKLTRRAVSHNHLIPKLPDLADKFEQHLRSHAFESSSLEHYGYAALRPMFI